MRAPAHRSWLGAALLAGVVYLAAGLVFGELAGAAGSGRARVLWRLAAWIASALAFAVHVGWELFRRLSPPRATAAHVALGTALGAFGLAAAANIHALRFGSSHLTALRLALLVWPLITALPAFVVALVGAAVLRWLAPMPESSHG